MFKVQGVDFGVVGMGYDLRSEDLRLIRSVFGILTGLKV
jgi:hypothetical protein